MLDIRRKLMVRQPDNVQWMRDLALALDKVGNKLKLFKNLTGARPLFEEEVALDRKTVASEPDNNQYQRDLGFSLNQLGDLLGELNDLSISLRQLSEQTARDPASLLRGTRPVADGPGEAPSGSRPP